MVRNLMATTAIAVLLSTAAYAQENTAPAPAAPAPMTQDGAAAAVARSDGNLASMMIGETVYNGSAENAEKIGHVTDIVIGANGSVESVIVGVGGFLGLGEKNVAVNFADVSWAERDGDRWLVVPATKEQLTAQAEFDRRPYDLTAGAPAPAATDDMVAAPATDTNTAPATTDTIAAAPATDPSVAPATDGTQTTAIDRSTLTAMPIETMRAEELIGTNVYGANDADVGEIGDVIVTQDGKADAVIIDVGGFLGLGAKEVAVGMDKLSFMTDTNGTKYLYTTFTKEQLEAQPAYDKATWAEQRDQQRMMMQ